MNRLHVIAPELFRKLRSSDPCDALGTVSTIIADAANSVGEDVKRILLGRGLIISDLPPYVLGCSQVIVDELDAEYFETEEAGHCEGSRAHFSAARLVSACVRYMSFRSLDDLCEAAYEAMAAKR